MLPLLALLVGNIEMGKKRIAKKAGDSAGSGGPKKTSSRLARKRLERGTFRRVKDASGEPRVEIDAADLAMLFAGIDAERVSRRKRYQHPGQARPNRVTVA